MASYFAVGLPFTFDGTTNHFATTSGGGASVANPTTADTVTFDGNSGTGTCTFTADLSCSTFASSSANVTLAPGSHTINVAGTGTAWNMTAGTYTAGTSTISMTGAGPTFAGGGKAYGTLSMTGSGTYTISGTNTFVNLTRTGTAVKTDALSYSANQTITGTLTLAGNTNKGVNRLIVQSGTVGTTRTLTMTGGAVVINGDVDFADITISGAPSWTNSGTAFVGDCGGNSGLTTTTPAAQTWSGNTTANYSTAADWTSRVPLPQDNVAINGLTSGTVTVDMPRIGANIDLTGSSGGSFSWNTSITSFGNVTMASGVTASGGSNFWSLQGRGAQTFTNNSVTWSASTVRLSIDAGGTYTMQDAMTMVTNATPSLLRLQLGTLDLGTSFSHTLGNLTVSGGTFNGHSCTLTLNATGVANVINISGGTINASATNFVVASSTTGTRTFIGLAKAYGNLTINGAVGASAVAVTSANTFATITAQADSHLTLPASTTTTCTGFTSNGSSGHVATLDSSSSGTAATLSCANVVNTDFMSIKDSTASGNTPFYAGHNSTLVSGTTNWTLGNWFSSTQTAAGSFSGAAVHLTNYPLTAALSFVGAVLKLTSRHLTATSAFTGRMVKLTARALAATGSFTGQENQSTQTPLSATLSFTGNFAPAIFMLLAAALSFSGVLAKVSSRALTATLGFVGAVTKQAIRLLTGALSSAGQLLIPLISQIVSGALGFSAATTRQTGMPLTAALSFTGALLRAVTHVLTATLSFVGAAAHAASRTLTAALSFAGRTTQMTRRALSGTASSVGALARTAGNGFHAVLSFAGSIPQRQIRHVLRAGVSFTGTVARTAARALAGTLFFSNIRYPGSAYPSGSMYPGSLLYPGGVDELTRQTNIPFNPSLGFSGVISRVINAVVRSVLSFTGSLSRAVTHALTASTLSFTGAFLRGPLLSGALSYAGTIGRGITAVLTGVLRFTGRSIRQTTHAMLATLAPVGRLANQTARQLAAVLDFIGAIPRIHEFTAALSAAGSLTKSARHSLAASLTFAGRFLRGRAFAGSLAFTGTVRRRATVVLSAGLAATGAISRFVRRTLSGAVTFVGNFFTGLAMLFTASLTFAGKTVRSTHRSLAGVLSFSGLMRKRIARALTAVLSLSVTFAHVLGKIFVATLSFTTRFGRGILHRLASTLGFTGRATRRTARALVGVLNLTGHFGQGSFVAIFTAALNFTGHFRRPIRRIIDLIVRLVTSVVTRPRPKSELRISGEGLQETRDSETVEIVHDVYKANATGRRDTLVQVTPPGQYVVSDDDGQGNLTLTVTTEG